MKKTVRINISGLIFNIDEDAYNKLQQYLNSITKKFLNTEEGNEIIADVETRIAELFHERIGDRKEVVSLSDVEHIIEVMGSPEEFEEVPEEETAYEEPATKKANRRIYRDSDNRILGGLAAGIATYFNVDPMIIRAIFVLLTLFYGTSILIYVLLWIIIPEAKTRSQKLEMRGQDINLSNIESSIKNEFQQVKTNFEKWQKSGGYDNLRTNVGSILNMFWKVMLIFVKFLLIIMGIGFFIFGIGMLGTMTGVFFLNDTFLSPFSWNGIEFRLHDFVSLFTDGFTARVGIIASYLLFLIPILSIIYLGLRFIFKFRTKNKYIGLYAGSLWLVSLFVLIGAAVKVGYGNRASEEVMQSYPIDKPGMDTLYINLFEGEHYNDWDSKFAQFGNVFIKMDEEDLKLYGQPDLQIVKSENNKTLLKVYRESDGMNKTEALKFAKNIKYEWQQVDSVFYFRRYFSIDGKKKVKDQRVVINFEVPVDKVIYLGKDIDYITGNIDFAEDTWDSDIDGKYWIMTVHGLIRLDDYKNDMKDGKLDNKGMEESNIEEPMNQNEIEQMKNELDSM